MPLEAQLGLGDQQRFASEDEYALVLSRSLEEAYSHARVTQQLRRDKDKAARDNLMPMPNGKPGRYTVDNLCKGALCMLWEPEVRVKEAGKVPKKWEYLYTGPHRVYDACSCGNHRWIVHQRRRKLVKTNVNRLLEWKPYTDKHLFTDSPSAVSDGSMQEGLIEAPFVGVHKLGDLVAIPLLGAQAAPYALGRLLEKRHAHENGWRVQWFANVDESLTKPLRPGWAEKDKRPHAPSGSVRFYYRNTPTHYTHPPYTNDDTGTNFSPEWLLPVHIQLSHPEGGTLLPSCAEALLAASLHWRSIDHQFDEVEDDEEDA
jgi:hypothetical protein